MFPLQPDLLFWVKVFVLFTCVFFWIQLIYARVRRSNRMRPRPWDEDEE
jgi:hypothetical protein